MKTRLAILRSSVFGLALLFAGAAGGGSAHAAQLGSLAVFSDFGAPLKAVIEVVEVSPQSRPVAAQVASPQTYAELGVAFPSSLEGAVVRLFQQPDGRWLIRILSRRVVDEPDFSLVVSLTTDIGRQVRQYRLAPDAPEGAAPAGGAPSSATDRSDTGGVPAVPSSSAPVTERPGPAAPTPEPAAERVPAEPRAGTVTVQRGDTATSIARRIKPDDVSDEQAVMALYRANERTFRGSVHRLAQGAVLRVPGPDALREVDPRAARAALRAQPFVSMAPRDQGAPRQDRLLLAGGGTGRATSKHAGRGTGSDTTAAVAHDAAMGETNSRIDELGGIVDNLRKLLELREQQIAAAEGDLAALRTGVRPSGAIAGPDRAAPLGAATATLIRSPARAVSAPAASVAGSAPTPAAGGALLERLLSPPVLGAALAVLGLAGVLLWRRRRLAARNESAIQAP